MAGFPQVLESLLIFFFYFQVMKFCCFFMARHLSKMDFLYINIQMTVLLIYFRLNGRFLTTLH